MKRALQLVVMTICFLLLTAASLFAGYVNNGNGTVTDTSTGLTWQQETPDNAMTWQQALAYCEGLSLGGHTDWRLPTKKELRSLVDYSRYNPAINTTYFPDTAASWYWSSTTYAYNTNYAWYVYFDYGYDGSHNKYNNNYVRAVRGGQSGSFGNSVILTLFVYDTVSGEPIPNATVVVGFQSGQTNASGQVTFSGLGMGQYNLQVSATGYTSHTSTLSFNQGGSISQNVGMVKTAQIGPNTNPIVTDVVSYVSNRNKEAIFLHGSSVDVNFGAVVNWNGNTPGYVRFVAPGGSYDETDANRIFNMGRDFGAGGRLKVVAVSAAGKQSGEFDANIEVAPQPPGMRDNLPVVYSNQDFSYQKKISTGLIENTGVMVPKEVPLFGGEKFSFDALADIDANVESNGTATYTLIVNRDSKGFKIKGVAFDKGYHIGGNIVFRYDKSRNEWRLNGGHVVLSIEGSKGIGPSYYIITLGPVPVPTYLRGELAAELGTELGVTGFSESTGWQLDGLVEPGAGGKVIAGLGVSSVVALEAALGADASMQLGFPHSPVLREIEAVLAGSIRLVTFFWQQEWPVWEYKWRYPEEESGAMTAQSQATMLRDVRNAAWKPVPRTYSSGLSIGRMMTHAPELTRLTLASGTEQTLPGQEDIYPYSTPAMTRTGDDLLLTWITDDLTRTPNNRTSMVFSRYSSGQWSNPVTVADNGTADAYPSVAAMNGGVVAAWQDANTLFGVDAELADMLPAQEIAVSRFNPTTGVWGPQARLTSNGYLDRSPTVAARVDQALAVWIANEGNQILGTAEYPDRLEFSHYYDGAWHASGIVADSQGTIVRTGLIMNNDSMATLVYVKDEDGDLSTDTDQELYVSQFTGSVWSEPVRLTDDAVLDTSPRLAHDSLGNQILVWFKNGNFMMAKNLDMANAQTVVAHQPSSGAADFQLVVGPTGQIEIVWPDSSPKGQDLFMATYDPTLNLWGKGTQITDTDRMERSITAARTANGQVAVVYNSVEMTSEIRQVDVNGKPVDITVPVPGQTDLRMASVELTGDMAVASDSLVFSPTGFAQGDSVAVSATIENAGLTVQENIPVAFYYGDPASGGAEIGTRVTIAGPLAPGADASATAYWQIPKPADVTKQVYVVVDPDISLDDRDRGNNGASVVAFQPDLLVHRLFSEQIGPSRRAITVGVANTGNMAAANSVLTIRQGSDTGTVVFEQTLDTLEPGDARDVVFDWNGAGVATADGYVTFYTSVNPSHVIVESSYLNNDRSLQVLGAFPQMPTAPSIPDGGTNVSLNPTLSWQGDCTGGTTYDIYVWKSGESRPETATVSGVAGCSATLPTALDPESGYLWQVVGTNDSGATESDIWSFTTGTGEQPLAGDVNGDGYVDLKDAITALQVLAGMIPDGTVNLAADVDGDNRIGMAEVIYVLQQVAGL
ncbi:MAG: DUF1566 domain-containing protein [Desulfatirhabdiaceae bacterium]